MRYKFSFPFREQTYPASALFSFVDEPYFLSITLLDPVLISEFGPTLSVKTDGERMLLIDNASSEQTKLKTAVFDHVKQTPAFKQLKAKYSTRQKYRKGMKM